MEAKMLLLKGGRVVCPSSGIDSRLDVCIDGETIHSMAPEISAENCQVMDCSGAIIGPGLVDITTELADPGMTWREDLSTGSAAAAAGGFTSVVASPATNPVLDTPGLIGDLALRSAGAGGARILFGGALTVGLGGQELAEVGLLAEAGCCIISDGGRPVSDSAVLRRAMDYLRPFGLPIVLRPGEPSLSGKGCMHEGLVSLRVGLRGDPAATEEIGIARIIAVARATGTPVHISHVTTEVGVDMIAQAKSQGVRISASTPARNLILTDEAIERVGYDTSLRLDPPLRSEQDRAALCRGLMSGDLDLVIADHQPWSRVEKEVEFEWCQPGAMGLETAFSAVLTALEGDVLTTLRVLSVAPAALLGRNAKMDSGEIADLVVFEPGVERTVSGPWRSKGVNEPLSGHLLRGHVRSTIVGGQVVFGAG